MPTLSNHSLRMRLGLWKTYYEAQGKAMPLVTHDGYGVRKLINLASASGNCDLVKLAGVVGMKGKMKCET